MAIYITEMTCQNFFPTISTCLRQGEIYRTYQRLCPQCEHWHPAHMSTGSALSFLQCLAVDTMHLKYLFLHLHTVYMLSTKICGCTLQISHWQKLWSLRTALWVLRDMVLFLHNSSTEVIWVCFASQVEVQTLDEMSCFQDEVGNRSLWVC